MKKVLSILALASLSVFADVRSIEFPIPGNQYCDSAHVSEISFSISNLSDVQTSIKFDLYKIDGSPLLTNGTANNGMGSELILGEEFTLNNRATTTYHLPFGKGSTACSERVYHGKITIFGLNGRVIASGFISGRNQENFRSSSPIIINSGKSF